MFKQEYLDEAIQYVQKNIQLLQNEDLWGLYEKCISDTLLDQGALTQVLLNAGINPLQYMENTYVYMFDKVTFSTPVYEIPFGCKQIAECTFTKCEQLHKIIIPTSVNKILTKAFRDCEDLTELEYKGTKAQWDEITKAQNWKALLNKIQVICQGGIIYY